MDFAVKPTQPVNLAGAVTIAGTVPVSGAVGISGTATVAIGSELPDSSATATINGVNQGVYLPLTGYDGAALTIAAGSLVGTVTAFVTFDNTAHFVPTQFYDPSTFALQPTIVFGAANPLTQKGIIIPAGATGVSVNATGYTSGSADWTLSVTKGQAAPIVANTPGVTGALASQTVASGASSTAVVTAQNGSNVPLTTTIIAGSARQLELHSCTATFAQTGGASPAPNVGRLIRSDTGADIMTPFGLGASLPAGTYVQQKDFEGARLPAFVAVQSIIVQEGFGPTGTFTVDFNYNVVG